jgi:cytochrome c biogenesis protein
MTASPNETGAGSAPPRRGWLAELYDLLSNPGFAIVVLIVLAVASIAGVLILDQLPVRGEMARIQYADRRGEPLIWLLTHVVPERPFRSPVYETLLGLLSLSLLACTIKRWRHSWRLAFGLAPLPAGGFEGGETLRWRTRAATPPELATRFLRAKLFRVAAPRIDPAAPDTQTIAASRFGFARLGPVLTHLGFLLLVIGAIVLGLTGSSHMLWIGQGERGVVPGTNIELQLDRFRVDLAPNGSVAAYVSSVTLRDNGVPIRTLDIQVNKPLRYRGYSFYQNSYRQNPTQAVAIDLVYDVGASTAGDSASAPSPMGPHGRSQAQFVNPVTVTVPWHQRVALRGTPYAVEVDTFFVDFVIDESGPTLASNEPRNPAVRVEFFKNDQPAGRSWYFMQHPGMAVGTAPDLPMRFANFSSEYMTGLEVATHPGAIWVWLGFAVMSLGTLLAFLLRHERVWLRLRRLGDHWEIAAQHRGAPRLPPEFARAPWEQQATGLMVQLTRELEPDGPPPVRGPERRPA